MKKLFILFDMFVVVVSISYIIYSNNTNLNFILLNNEELNSINGGCQYYSSYDCVREDASCETGCTTHEIQFCKDTHNIHPSGCMVITGHTSMEKCTCPSYTLWTKIWCY